jgi:hypothetical protein
LPSRGGGISTKEVIGRKKVEIPELLAGTLVYISEIVFKLG